MSEVRSRDDEPPTRGSLAGTTIHERYEIVRELGAGSLGRVYLARDRARGGGAIALKVVRHDRLSAEALDYLRLEFQNLARLRHPNVARVYDLDKLAGDRGEDLVFFTEEFLDGPDLVQAVQATREACTESPSRQLDVFLELFVQTLRGLAYVHARGLLHADVKPRNLFVVQGEDGPQRVKVCDFHLARELAGPSDRSLRGTIAYMAPEVVKGEPSDARADLYSLGVVAYEALTGSLPFSARNPLDVLRAHATEKVDPLRERGAKIPAALEAVVLRLLEKDPDARFRSANDTIRALNVALGKRFALETTETREGYILSPRFVGREHELGVLLESARAVRGAVASVAPRSARKRRAVEISLDGLGSDTAHLAIAAAEAERSERERAARASSDPAGAKTDSRKSSETRPISEIPGERTPPRVFAVTGEGGVGKSRLLRELRVLCQVEGLSVHEAKAAGLDARPFAPFLEILESALRREGDAAVLARAVGPSGRVELPRVLELMSPTAAPDEGPRAARLRATAALGELLLACSRDRPFIALVESAEALDEASLELVRYLAEEGGGARALFVLAARDDGEGSPLAEIATLESGAELALERLPAAASGELVASMVAAESVPEELARRLHEATGGNPRFMEESLRSLAEAEAISTRDGKLSVKLDAVANLAVSRGVVEIALRRIARLEGPARTLFEAFAVFARPRPLELAAQVAGLGIEAADLALAELAHRGLVTGGARGEGDAATSGAYEVTSEPVRDAALESLSPERATALHRASALLLETSGDRDGAEELLHHLASAGEPGRASVHALAAAEAARSRFEPVKAQRLYARALDLMEKARETGEAAPLARVALARVRLGEARLLTGDRRGAALAFAEAAHDPSTPAAVVALALRLDASLKKSLGAYDRAERALDKASRAAHVATREGDPEGERESARGRAERAGVLLWRGNYAGALAEGTRALEKLRALGARDELSPLLQVLYHAAHFSGDDARAREFLTGGLEAQAHDDPRARADETAPGPRAALAILEGSAPRGGSALGDAGGAHVPLSTVGVAFDRAGRPSDLEALYEKKVDVLEAVRDGEGAALAHNNLANLRRLAGRYDLAIRGYRRSLNLHRSLGGRPGVAVARLNLARAMSELGDPAGAEPRAERARATARACGSRWIEAQAELAVADATRRQGKLAPSREAVARARAIVRSIKNVPLLAEVELAAAEVELDAGDLLRAGVALDSFGATPTAVVSAPSVARARILRANLLVARARQGPEGDRVLVLEQASHAASDALDTARTLGAPELEWRAARARAAALAAQGEREAAVEDLVVAMETLRRVAKGLPRDLRALYLSDPARLEVKEAFRALGG